MKATLTSSIIPRVWLLSPCSRGAAVTSAKGLCYILEEGRKATQNRREEKTKTSTPHFIICEWQNSDKHHPNGRNSEKIVLVFLGFFFRFLVLYNSEIHQNVSFLKASIFVFFIDAF